MDEIKDASPAYTSAAPTVARLFNEETTVEREIIEHLQTPALGWTYRSREQVTTLRPDEREVLLLPLLREKLRALNPTILTDEARVDAIITKLRGCRDNQQWLAWLQNGVNHQFDPAEKAKDVRLIDFDNIDENEWWVTNQFPVEGNSPRRPDMVLLINGIPVVVIEAKTASRNKPDWREGAKQLGMYSEEIDQLFYTNAYGVGVNETRMMYGVPGRRLQFWLQWRDPWPHSIDEFDEMKVSLYGLFDRANMLDFIRHFIVFVTKDGKTDKVVVRYQQYLAVKDILGRATDLTLPPEKRRGLIWHTQGSGKTLTMIYAARSLWEDPKLNQPTVILLVDREQLGDQMDRELMATGTENVHVALSKKDLQAKLGEGDGFRGVILTTVHLFEGMPKHITKQRKNVIVMADEAHRTQERELGTYMRAAVDGASLFGFTGTPIEKDDHNTPVAWGQVKDDGTIERYMGRPYTVTDALHDGVIKPVHWQPRKTDWQLYGEKLDLAFKREFGHLPEAEQNKLVSQSSTLDVLLKLDKRIKQIADDAVAHFNEHVRPNGFKAMLVCKDKETVRLYTEALRARLGDEAVMAVISEAPKDDPEAVRALYLGEAKRKKLLNEFLIPAQSELQEHQDKELRKVEVLVVCDMLLTGFDAPILQALYLDRKLVDHTLLQTIARVNRPYNELKGHGLVLDYYGIFDHLNEALNYRPDELGDIAFPFALIREHFRSQFDTLWVLFPEESVPRDGSHSAFIAAMKILRDEEGAEKTFDTGYRNLRVLYEALQPDEELRDYVRPYAWLTKLYMLYRKKFYPDAAMEATDEDAARTKELIRQHIDVEELEKEFPTYVLDEHFLTKLKDKKPDAKALDIEAMLTAELRIRLDQDESFRPLSEKLQRIIDEKRAGTLAGIALIGELESLTEAVRAAVAEAKRPIGQQLALKIKTRNVALTEAQAAEVAAAILEEADKHCFPGWWNSSSVDPELSRALLLVFAQQFSALGLLGGDAMNFIGQLVQVLKRKHYKPGSKGAE